MQLEQRFIQARGIKEYRVESKFHSKKNEVYRLRAVKQDGEVEEYVAKVYTNPGNVLDKEVVMLTGLKEREVPVPTLYYRGEGHIILEFLNGPTLLDTINDLEERSGNCTVRTNWEGMAVHLCRWLRDFYKASSEITGIRTILWDVNLRNFLVTYKIYGLDFEDCREGLIEEDAGRLFSYIITYQTAFTDFKMNFARQVLNILGKELSLDRDRVIWEIRNELDAIRSRRDMQIPEDIAKSIML